MQKVLERFDLFMRPNVGTMGVTVVGDDVRLLCNPGFVLSIPPGQLTGVLLYEVHHVVFEHIFVNRRNIPMCGPGPWPRRSLSMSL